MAANMMKYCASLVFALLFTATQAWGEVLADPTRPPFGISAAGLASVQAAEPQVKGLQSVMMSPARCAAIIDGKTVALGDRHGNEQLIEVNERGVVLQGEHGRRALTLFPAVGMKITQAMPENRQAIACKFEQIKHTKIPAEQAGQKEKK